MQPHFGQEQAFINNGQHPLFLVDDAAETGIFSGYPHDPGAGNDFLESSTPAAIFKNDIDRDEINMDEEEPRDLADGNYDD